ncbi:type II secretion system F family protein [Pectobacterium zantedeschiae]|uniref:type II secretion system F family protein n=1 Tax=Pectobacterium zantedeschiae TaxID=2034769 RepID=UPI00101C5C45|nr:type II secretion system F family protein [Pectobacterium zantedeschiae]RYC43348.1 type II secretion system F family protein [Pectobacterium zantedeschiae]
MKSYNVIYLDNGQRKTALVTASSSEEAGSQFTQDGFLVIKVVSHKLLREKRFPLDLFIQELVALLEAGLVITEAIEALQTTSRETPVRNIYDRLLEKLYQGHQLSQAMATLPDIFPALLLNAVASSEQTGHLPIVLKRFRHYEQRMETLRKRVKATLLYPTIVMSVGGLILCFLLGFIIPRFAQVFDGMKNPNGSARFILWWGKQVENHGSLLLMATLIGIATLVIGLRHPRIQQFMARLLLKQPQLRHQHHITILVRFYRTLGLLLQSGLSVPQALDLTRSVLPASHHAQLQQVQDGVHAGQMLSTMLESQQLTTPIATRLLQVGERSGELSDMCGRIAAFYDEALERAIETFSKVFEPVLMIAVGGIVGLVVFLLYMPIFELAGGLS